MPIWMLNSSGHYAEVVEARGALSRLSYIAPIRYQRMSKLWVYKQTPARRKHYVLYM